MTRKKVVQKRKERVKAEGSELFQNNHTDYAPRLIPDVIESLLKPFVHIIGGSRRQPRRKKSKRKWTFVDDD